MASIRRTAVLVLAHAAATVAARTPTWPDETNDILESILYEQAGDYSTSFSLNIAGCGKNDPSLPGQNEAAQWLRAGFHDVATADVAAGTGGLDASIAFELDRAENPGTVEFTNTLAISRTVLTSKMGVADGVAMTVLIAAQACSDGQVDFDYRYGRVDATQAGEKGVPEPGDAIESMEKVFAKAGFTKTEMIGLVACGHSVGGVNGVDFPTIVTVPANDTSGFVMGDFDSTDTVFDNKIATEYVDGTSNNPLASGHNVAMRSDARIFDSDGKREISRLASSNDAFHKTCGVLLEKMVNTVPRGAKLTAPVVALPAKPMALFATVNDNGTMTFHGTVRLIDQKEPNPNRKVNILLHGRGASACAATTTDGNVDTAGCRAVPAIEDPHSATYTLFKNPSRKFPEFKRYDFSTTIPAAQGLASFYVHVTDKKPTGGASVQLHTNSGRGFPFADTILPQYDLSCIDGSNIGLLNLTVAVRNDAQITSLEGSVEVPTKQDTNVPADRTTYVPRLARKPLTFMKVGEIKGAGYTLWHAQHVWDRKFFKKHYDLRGVSAGRTYENLFNDADLLRQCA